MPPFYRPPADIDDFSQRPDQADELRQNWHDYIARAIADRAKGSGLFYDAANDPNPAVIPAKASIAWNAFPRSISQWFNADADPAGAGQALLAAETLKPEMTLSRRSDGN